MYTSSKENELWTEIDNERLRRLLAQEQVQAEARLKVPYCPQLFGKQPPIVLELSRVALAKYEVFLILAKIYAEAKGQEKTVMMYLQINGSVTILDPLTPSEQHSQFQLVKK
jgi:hypothetical protein